MDTQPDSTSVPSFGPLREALLAGDQELAIAATSRLLAAGVDPERVVADGVQTAMEELDAKCTADEFNLLEIMLSGRAAMGVMKELFPAERPPERTRGTVVLATLEGDVHDLGKNIVKMVLTARGYRVLDCGKDCPVERLVDMAEQEAAQAVGVSGLLTTVLPQVRRVRDALDRRGLAHVAVMAGGAALKQASAESLNVAFLADNAFDGGRFLDQTIARRP